MRLQAVLDELCLLKLPKVLRAIDSAREFERNQMKYHAISKCNNLPICIEDMKQEDIRAFEEELLDNFRYKMWMI